MVDQRDPENVAFGSLPDRVKDTIRSMNRGGKVEVIWDLGNGTYAVEYTDKTYIHVDKDGKPRN